MKIHHKLTFGLKDEEANVVVTDKNGLMVTVSQEEFDEMCADPSIRILGYTYNQGNKTVNVRYREDPRGDNRIG